MGGDDTPSPVASLLGNLRLPRGRCRDLGVLPARHLQKLRGHRCTACGLVVSEESRRKEKIGGLNGKGLAKAKCPKCGGKFGTAPLYQVKQKAAETEAAGETPSVEKAAG